MAFRHGGCGPTFEVDRKARSSQSELRHARLSRHPALIDGAWRPAASGRTLAVVNPATGQAIGTVAYADKADLDAALAAAATRLRGLAQDFGL